MQICPADHFLVDQDWTQLVERAAYHAEDLYDPYIRILNELPFVIPFEARVRIFRQYIYYDKNRADPTSDDYFQARKTVQVRRDHIFRDGYIGLNPLGPEIKRRVAIQFVDSQGMAEAGIDGGGLFKEFLTTYRFLLVVYRD